MLEEIISSSYVYFFLDVFYACALTSYVFFFSFRKAYLLN